MMKKVITVFVSLTLTTSAQAQTNLNLSQSSTFQSKANINSPAFTGSPSAPQFTVTGSVYAGEDGSNGYVDLTTGSSVSPGTIEFRTPDGTRRMYIGYSRVNSGGDSQIAVDNNWGIDVEGRIAFGCASNTTYPTYFCNPAYFGNSVTLGSALTVNGTTGFNAPVYMNGHRVDVLAVTVGVSAYTSTNGATRSLSGSISGAALGDQVECSPTVDPGQLIITGIVTAASTVRCQEANITGASINVPNHSLNIKVSKWQ